MFPLSSCYYKGMWRKVFIRLRREYRILEYVPICTCMENGCVLVFSLDINVATFYIMSLNLARHFWPRLKSPTILISHIRKLRFAYVALGYVPERETQKRFNFKLRPPITEQSFCDYDLDEISAELWNNLNEMCRTIIWIFSHRVKFQRNENKQKK